MKCIKINYNPKTYKSGVLVMPPSKSIAARRLLIDALSESASYDFTKSFSEDSHSSPIKICDDIIRMERGLKGESGDTVNINASGTAMRLLTAFYAVKKDCVVNLTGIERMLQRPIKLLVDTLRSLGARIEYLGQEDYPPLRIFGKSLKGGKASIDGSVSSQYISALLLIAPTMKDGLELTLTGRITSRPYIEMTLQMMRQRGIQVDWVGNLIEVKPGEYTKNDIAPIEGDWSAAGFWYQYALSSGNVMTLEGLTMPSLQGDAQTALLYQGLGVESRVGDNSVTLIPGFQNHTDSSNSDSSKGRNQDRVQCSDGSGKEEENTYEIVRDLSAMPDLVPSLATALCLTGRTFSFSGIANLRIKECDRLAVITSELAKVGYSLTFDNDSLSWDGERTEVTDIPRIDPYNDHRMAMAMAFGSMRFPSGIIIENPDCVDKSYPSFWDDMKKMGFVLEVDQLNP